MKLTLIEKKEEVPGVTSFIFEPEEALTWKAGQYLHYVLHHEPTDDRGSDRWFTVASAPFEKKVMITTRLAAEKGSSFKKELAGLEIGASIEISAVEGDFTLAPERECVFIAGGIGITPFHSILKQADHAGEKPKIKLFYSNRDENVPFRQEIETFAKNNPNLLVHFISAPKRIDEPTIREFVPDLQSPLFYVSGPEPMVKSLADVLESMGVPKNNIKLDDFPGYPAD
jgi:ferredoxin-NADP reductase